MNRMLEIFKKYNLPMNEPLTVNHLDTVSGVDFMYLLCYLKDNSNMPIFKEVITLFNDYYNDNKLRITADILGSHSE